ncbi:MAG: FAD:protein FMN transferase [Paracoccaceae bacterium]|nr:FAD:protein FMN transferase [Paracoccaceae bacterium]
MNRRRFITVIAAACAGPTLARATPLRWQGRAMGAEVSLDLYGARPEALASARATIDRMERIFSLYDPHSELSRINVSGGGALSPEMAEVLDLSAKINAATGGRFDPTVQPVFAALLAGEDPPWHTVGWDKVSLSDKILELGTGQALTLNGIAQGYVTDRVRTVLAAHGLTRALVAIGEHAALGGPFRLGLADPEHGQIGTRTLTDGAIATSSPGAMRLGQGFHILSPKNTDVPLWSTVSVEASSAAVADALSTALCLAPLKTVRDVARTFAARVTLVDAAGDVVTVG